MTASSDTIILLPAYNEERSIRQVIREIQDYCQYGIVVAASECTDHTVEIARSCGADVVIGPRGKGRAVSHALKQIKNKNVLMMDSDMTYPAKSIPAMVYGLENYDCVAGTRQFNQTNMPALNKWGNAFITAQARMIYGYDIRDLCTGMWALRSDVVKTLNIKSYGFTLEAELFIHIAKNRFTLGQLPIEYRERIGKKKINRMDHLKIMWYLWSRMFV